MPGLNFGTFGGVRASLQPQTAVASAHSAPTSVTSAAFGDGYSGGAPSIGAALAPNDAFGIAFWLGVLAIGGLVLIRQSLPR